MELFSIKFDVRRALRVVPRAAHHHERISDRTRLVAAGHWQARWDERWSVLVFVGT